MRCPYCDAEVASDDVYCGECGKQLTPAPREGMRSRWPLIVGIVGILVVVCLAGGVILTLLVGWPPTPTTEPTPSPVQSPAPMASSTPLPAPTAQASWLTFSSTDLGLALRYPEDWLVAEDPTLMQVVLAPEQEDLEVDEFLRGTSFAVVVNSTEGSLIDAPEEALEQVGEFLTDTYADADVGEAEPFRVAKHEGARMAIEGEFTEAGVRFKGWLAATIAYDHVFIFVAGAPIEDWPQLEATLQAMLDSVALSQPTATALQPSPTAGATAAPATPTNTVAPPVLISGADAYEPDDTLVESRHILTDGSPQAHNLHTQGDRDYVYFQASEGNVYTIETFGLGAEIDTIIYLYDAQEQELARNDDWTEGSLASRIVWIAPSGGTYYVMIRDLSEGSSGPDASYSISVEESTVVEGADPYEPDDDAGWASQIETDGISQTHTFHTTTDVDIVWFYADAGLEYVIETGNLLGGCDTVLSLYDEDGYELTSDDDAGEGGYASRIVWPAPADGIYYAAAQDYGGRAGPGVSYEIWVSTQ
jgi:hypothetical protein